jgi:site-specific DNA-methyltransferase (adenine-specific)
MGFAESFDCVADFEGGEMPMNPYYQDNHVTIYHGDCVQIMPLLPPVDLMITDPPYGMMFRSNYRITKYDRIINDNCLPVEMIIAAIEKARRAAYVFCRWDNLREMPVPKNVLAWVKDDWSAGDLKHSHGRKWEACCFYPKDDHVFSRRIPDVIEAPRTLNKHHPTEKPVDLMARLIDCNIGDVVLDPFMGSGTTLRAAKDLRRKAIGIEIEECYCEIAAERMAQEVLAL